MISGYYLNLVRAKDRRAHMEAGLRRVGLADRYHRHEAVDGNDLGVPGAMEDRRGACGLWSTWRDLLHQNRDSPAPIHIREDDVVLSPRLASFFVHQPHSIERDSWDLIFPFMNIHVEIGVLWAIKSMLPHIEDNTLLLTAENAYSHSKSSVIINNSSIGKLLSLFPQEPFPKQGLDVFYVKKSAGTRSRRNSPCLFSPACLVTVAIQQSICPGTRRN